MAMWPLASVSRKYSFRSMPAEKLSPAPVSTSTPQRSSASRKSSTSCISWLRVGFMQLRFSGRFSVTHATPPSKSTRTVDQALPAASDAEEEAGWDIDDLHESDGACEAVWRKLLIKRKFLYR